MELVKGRAGDQHTARLADLLQTSRDVHPIAEQVIALNHHVTEIDADAEDNAPFGRDTILLSHDALLHRHGAGHRVHHRAELDDRAVAHQLDDAPVMLGQERIDHLTAQGFQGAKRPGFVHFHEMRVPDDIRRQDRHQPPLHPCCRHGCFSLRRSAGRSRVGLPPSHSTKATQHIAQSSYHVGDPAATIQQQDVSGLAHDP